MSSTGGLFGQTLQSITNTKLIELVKKRDGFEAKRKSTIDRVSKIDNDLQKLIALYQGVRTCFSVPLHNGRVVRGSTGDPELETDLRNLERFVVQAKYDPSITSQIHHQWRASLVRHLDIQSVKFTYADLYGQLTNEWLSTKQKTIKADPVEDTEMEDFEHVPGGSKLESRAKWEHSVFEATAVDSEAIKEMLKSLFEAKPNDSKQLLKAMKKLREKVANHEREMAAPNAFDTHSLAWTVASLLAADLLTEEKRTVLKDFQGNTVIMSEIADVLNMRMAGLDTWSWGDSVTVEQRRQLNGTFSIYMHEDILEAIFLQYIGIKWSVFFKDAFSAFRKFKGVWKTTRSALTTIDKMRRDYFLGPMEDTTSVVSKKQGFYRENYFVARLQDSITQHMTQQAGDEEAVDEVEGDFDSYGGQARKGARTMQTACRATNQTVQQAPQAGGLFGGSAPMQPRKRKAAQAGSFGNRRARVAIDDDDDEFDDDPNPDRPRDPMDAKQTLLHLLSTDILIKSRTKGEITCLRSQIEDLFPSLPHATIMAVLPFFGVSEKWLSFFKRFLEAPLQFMDDASAPRKRRQGTPGAHTLSEVFSEVVLFGLDFQINQVTAGEPLWRIGDDFWFWSSSHDTCIKAWAAIKHFASTTGLSLNEARTGGARISQMDGQPKQLVAMDIGYRLPSGKIRWGMLFLNPATGHFEIDQKIVDKHIQELSRQLRDKSSSVFSWIQAWNTYADTFFTSNFGKPANCFGRLHLDNMLATHERIQREVFSSASMDSNGATAHAKGSSNSSSSSSSVVQYLKQTLADRFNITDIPDGYFFFPTELGGLELRSPFIGLLQIRDAVLVDPGSLLDIFEEAEQEAYRAAQKDFLDGSVAERREYADDARFVPNDKGTFMPWKEFVRYREEVGYDMNNGSNELSVIYQRLLMRPTAESIECNQLGPIIAAISALASQSNSKRSLKGITSSFHSMEPYWRWVAQLYGPEIIERFGGFSIVDAGLLPMGMVALLRGGRVAWRE